MEESETEWTSVDILHPEMLGKDDLIDLLSQKHIKVDHLYKTKDDILELFHRTVTPLPQREPRSNRRGQSIAQVQKRLLAKRNVKSEGSVKTKDMLKIGFFKSSKNAEDIQRISNASSSHSLGRLKPPPVVSSKQRTIRLKSSTSQAAKPSLDSSVAAVTHTKDDVKFTASSNQASKDYYEPKKTLVDKSSMQMKTNDSSAKKATLSCTPTIRRDFSTRIKLNACGSVGVSSVSDKVQKISLKSPGYDVETGISKMGIKRTAPLDATVKTSCASTSSSDEKVKTASEGDSSPKKKIKRISWP